MKNQFYVFDGPFQRLLIGNAGVDEIYVAADFLDVFSDRKSVV